MVNYTLQHKKKQDLKVKMELKKISNIKFSGFATEHLTKSGLLRVQKCGDFLAMVADKTLDKKKLFSGEFCKNRFCPMCAYREARKNAFKIGLLMKYVEEIEKKSFVFLTFTAPNVKGYRLKDELDKFNYSFKKLMLKKEVVPVNKGYIRKLEITYDSDPTITYDMWHGNTEKHIKPRAEYYQHLGFKIGDENPNYDTYHPHFHVIMAVNKSYFTDKTYVKQEKWLSMWQLVMNDPSITQVHVEKVKPNEENKHIQEVAKYAAKDSDMLVNQDVFDTFYNSLKGRQVITYNGLFKDTNKLYKLFIKKKGEERTKDPFFKYIEIDETEYIYFLLYRWGFKEYAEEERRELTEEEKKKVNHQMIDETEVDE